MKKEERFAKAKDIEIKFDGGAVVKHKGIKKASDAKNSANIKCSLCEKTFDKDNIVFKTKDVPLCEKCYAKTIEQSVEEERNAKKEILKGFENIRMSFMTAGKFTKEVNDCLERCSEVVRKELA